VSQRNSHAYDHPATVPGGVRDESGGESGPLATSIAPTGRRPRFTASRFGRLALALGSGAVLVALLPAAPAQALDAGGVMSGGPGCSAGQLVTGGGVAVVGEGSADFHLSLNGSQIFKNPDPGIGESWYSLAQNLDSVAHAVGTFGVCVNPTAGYQVASKNVTAPAGGYARDIATCPAGTVALGGGFRDLTAFGTNGSVLEESAPSTSGGLSVWLIAAHNYDTSAHTLMLFTVCANAPAGYQVIHKDLTVAAGGFVRDTALCPVGTVVYGGGVAVVHSGTADFKTQMRETAPGTAGGQPLWLTALRNTDSAAHTISLYAVCANALPGYHVIRG
jgi:hypothetical protein